jgi:hypothetical protein
VFVAALQVAGEKVNFDGRTLFRPTTFDRTGQKEVKLSLVKVA